MTEPRKIEYRKTDRLAVPVKGGVTIARGAMVGLEASGYAVEVTETTGLTIVGVCASSADNKEGLDGDASVEIERYGAYRFDNDANDPVTIADLTKPVFASGPFSITKTDGGGTRSQAGYLSSFDDDTVYISFDVK